MCAAASSDKNGDFEEEEGEENAGNSNRDASASNQGNVNPDHGNSTSSSPENVTDRTNSDKSVSGRSGDDIVLDMRALRRRMEQVKKDEKIRSESDSEDSLRIEFAYGDEADAEVDDFEVDEDTLHMLNEQFEKLEVLYVILFQSSSSKEGVYSLALNGVNIILAFQERSEARRYAMMLEAQSFPNSKVSEFKASELKNFCGKSGHRLGLVPKGSLLTPPDETVTGSLDEWVPQDGDSSSSRRAQEGTGMDPDEIEVMKQRLENLFGGDTSTGDDDTTPGTS